MSGSPSNYLYTERTSILGRIVGTGENLCPVGQSVWYSLKNVEVSYFVNYCLVKFQYLNGAYDIAKKE